MSGLGSLSQRTEIRPSIFFSASVYDLLEVLILKHNFFPFDDFPPFLASELSVGGFSSPRGIRGFYCYFLPMLPILWGCLSWIFMLAENDRVFLGFSFYWLSAFQGASFPYEDDLLDSLL